MHQLPTPYEAPFPQLWKGRATAPELEVQYWYQQVQLLDLEKESETDAVPHVALLGYVCDEGVRRNKGRVGAAQGPNAIRKQLARLAFHHNSIQISDYGNLLCADGDLEGCQKALSVLTEQLLTQGSFPIVLGGGHDVAYGHFVGIHKALQQKGNSRIGIINFDAHFDLRPVADRPHSGTPFNQILSAYGSTTDYFALGIQPAANSPELFAIAKEKEVTYLFNDVCENINYEVVTSKLHAFIERNDALYLTIDLDGFSSAYAPGVSAPSALGFSPAFAVKILNYLMQTQKVVAVDIAELNPRYDRDQCTAKLAARIVDTVVGGL